jgi:superfamily II DNA or RNA helicase
MSHVVNIRKAGGLLQIIPPHEQILQSTLTCVRRQQIGGSGGQANYTNIQAYEIREHDSGKRFMLTHVGLLSRIINTLNSYNIPHSFEDLRPLQLESPKFEFIGKPRPGQDEILAKIACTDRGQIVAPTGDGKSWVICQVCRMYPNTRILVVVAGRFEAKNIRDRLVGIFPSDEVGQVGGGRRELNRRVTVCIRNSLMAASGATMKPKIILYDEVHTAGGPQTGYLLGFLSAEGPKMFGFTATANMRSDNADLTVEMLFGPLIHESTYEESIRHGNVAPIYVVMKSVPTGPVLHQKTTTAKNRHGLWRNDVRNQQIAADAREEAKDGAQLLIKVTTVEHGLELLQYLPEFVFIYSSMSKELRLRYEDRGIIKRGEHPISKHQQERIQTLFEEGKLRQVIATCWNQGVDFKQLGVLIRGDGTASDIQNMQVPGRLSRTFEGKEHGKLIDYMDDWDATLNRRAKERVRAYRKRGWPVEVPRRFGK